MVLLNIGRPVSTGLPGWTLPVRLTKVIFSGFKRLADTECNVDGRLIAIVGPNEAGKSSFLEALAWLSDRQSGALAGHLRSRAIDEMPETQPVVTAQFALDDDDRAAVADLDTDVSPHYYRLYKLANGTYQAGTIPQITRRRSVLDEAASSLSSMNIKYGASLKRNAAKTGMGDRFDEVEAALANADEPVDLAVSEAFAAVSRWLREPTSEDPEEASGVDDPHEVTPLDDAATAELLDAALSKLQEPDVRAESRRRLHERLPAFLMFQEADRNLASTYNLANLARDEQDHPAIANLLQLAKTTAADLRKVQASGDITRLKSLLKQANANLSRRLETTWRQSRLTVQLDTDGDLLEVLVDELSEDGAKTDISERSDGLRTFIALVAFLAQKQTEVPPVLMIDEAETHLHYDAQADLLDVLLNHVKTSKVIYTTHSPGCLPPDLGTGIRLVSQDPRNLATSTLRTDFWSSHEPGFSPLLFAMGAGAAAFSVCRRAVLAEGASDMILLPSLLRIATGEAELTYQVAPGLAGRPEGFADSAVAATVVYLADGDMQGSQYRNRLLAEGVDSSRIHTLPAGTALEDLLTTDSYLGAVHALMTEAGYEGPPVTEDQLRGQPGTIAARLRRWCTANGLQAPGKPAVANYLVQDVSRIALNPRSEAALRDLHAKFTAALG